MRAHDYTVSMTRTYAAAVIGMVLAVCVTPAYANKVHCETKLFHNGIRVAHDDKTSSDANRDYVTCVSSRSHGASHKGYAYAKEGWKYTGGQYVLDNYQYTNCVHYGCSTHAHHHTTSPTPERGTADSAPPRIEPPGQPTNISYAHVNYHERKGGRITVQLFQDMFVQIWLGGGLERGQQVVSSITLSIDGVASKVELSGRIGGGAESVTSVRTGLFEELKYRIKPYRDEVYVLQFTSPLRFDVAGTLQSDLELEGYTGSPEDLASDAEK